MVSRLTPQKGIDLLEKSLEHFVKNKIARVVLLGSGENRYEDFFCYLGKKYPRRALVQIGYNNSLSHKITAASDFFLIPSRFEPCGLTQMYALKYGTIPIVRATGGLADTVVEYDGRTGYGTGLYFTNIQVKIFAMPLIEHSHIIVSSLIGILFVIMLCRKIIPL